MSALTHFSQWSLLSQSLRTKQFYYLCNNCCKSVDIYHFVLPVLSQQYLFRPVCPNTRGKYIRSLSVCTREIWSRSFCSAVHRLSIQLLNKRPCHQKISASAMTASPGHHLCIQKTGKAPRLNPGASQRSMGSILILLPQEQRSIFESTAGYTGEEDRSVVCSRRFIILSENRCNLGSTPFCWRFACLDGALKNHR